MTDVQPEEAPVEEAEENEAAETVQAVGEPAEVAAPEAAAETVVAPPPAFRVMDVEDVSLDLPSQYPAVTLVEAEPPMRTLVFPVGLPEGTALALALRRMSSPRPLTHELFMQVMQLARLDVIAVRLIGRENGNYLAELDFMAPDGRERIPCRASDGLILALRMPVKAPILADERLLETSADVVPQER
jgi:bifunctional DNase/RNase